MRYVLLGRSGLRVSPLCLGTITFGTEWGWGVEQARAFSILDAYAEAGGNFVDTADVYTEGASERIVGAWMRERGNRERVVVGTKFTFNKSPGDPNAGGNGRKHIVRALDASLARLGTSYVDVYWLHAWDALTPVDEVVRTLDDVVRAGKVRYVAFSNVPAWYAARAWSIADALGLEKIVALQLEYSLVERAVEREHVPFALDVGVSVVPWGPLASGLLSGKHRRGQTAAHVEGEGRLKKLEGSTHPGFAKLYSDRNWRIADSVVDVARDIGRSPAQVALAWTMTRPAVSSTIVGATSPEQLRDNLVALDVAIPSEHARKLDELSALDVSGPYAHFHPSLRGDHTGGTDVSAEPASFRAR